MNPHPSRSALFVVGSAPARHEHIIRTPDLERPDQQSRALHIPVDRPIDPSTVDRTIPWVTLLPFQDRTQAIEVPAIIEVRGVLEDLKEMPVTGKKIGSWVVSAGPRHKLINEKLDDQRGLKARLGPMLSLLLERGAKVSAGWSIFFCPVRMKGDKTPFVEADFWSENRSKVEARNAKLRSRRAIPNFFRGLAGLPPSYPPEYVAVDPWMEDTLYDEIHGSVATRAGGLAESLWNAWIIGDSTATQELMLQEAVLDGLVPTRFEGIKPKRREKPLETFYFPEPVDRTGRGRKRP